MEHAPKQSRMTAERKSDCELVVNRIYEAPPALLYAAWTTPDLLKQWWVPRSSALTLVSCEVDARPGGTYRFEFGNNMVFFGTYLEAIPNARLVWTNEESPDGAITTLTFEAADGGTRLALHERYPTKEALDASMAGMGDGMGDGMAETLDQLDALLAAG